MRPLRDSVSLDIERQALGFLDAAMRSVLHEICGGDVGIHPAPTADVATRHIPGCRRATLLEILSGDVHLTGSRGCCR